MQLCMLAVMYRGAGREIINFLLFYPTGSFSVFIYFCIYSLLKSYSASVVFNIFCGSKTEYKILAKVSTPMTPYCDYCQLLFAIHLYSFLFLVDRYVCCSFILVNGVSAFEICSCIPSAEASKRNIDWDCRAMRLCAEEPNVTGDILSMGFFPPSPEQLDIRSYFLGHCLLMTLLQRKQKSYSGQAEMHLPVNKH